MKYGILIIHEEMGIYLGHCMGLGFWTLLDPVAQGEAVVFEHLSAARSHVSSWDDKNNPDNYSYIRVEPDSPDGRAISIAGLKRAGMESLMGRMEAEHRLYLDGEGIERDHFPEVHRHKH